MKSFDTLTTMADHLPAEACAQMRAILEEFPDHWDHPNIEQVSFTQLIDSPVFLVETLDDLAQVRSLDENEDQRLSLLQAASGWFDIAEWRCGEPTRCSARSTAPTAAQNSMSRAPSQTRSPMWPGASA
ncbi:hypothetical protein ACFSHP_08625 [Novosphingobium panipatense]